MVSQLLKAGMSLRREAEPRGREFAEVRGNTGCIRVPQEVLGVELRNEVKGSALKKNRNILFYDGSKDY